MSGFTKETRDVNQTLLAAKAKAVHVDLIADTTLSTTIQQTSEHYNAVVSQNAAVADELQAEIDSFLGLDFKFLKDKAIPFITRLDIVKKAAGKVLNVVKKVDPILKGINTAKEVLQSAQGDSFNEVPQAATKDLKEVNTALKGVEDQFLGLEKILKQIEETTKPLEDSFTDSPAAPEIEEDSFFPAIFLGIKAVTGAVSLIRNLTGR